MAQGYSGLNYEITPFPRQAAPTAPGVNPQAAAYQPPSIGGQLLADREGQTQELFDNYALLNSFAKDMAGKGIDVFTPDYSQPGGGLPYQTYLKLDAAVRFASNKLATQQKAQDQFLPLMYQNRVGLAPGQTMQSVDLTDPNQIQLYDPMYSTRVANERLAQPTNTSSASRAVNAAVYQPAIDNIRKLQAAGQLSDVQAELEISKLFANTPDPPVFQPRADSRASKTAQGNLDFLKAVTNQAAGNWAKGSYTPTVINGKRWDVSTRYAGERLGEQQVEKQDKLGNVVPTTVPIVVKDWIRDPGSGEIFMRFTDPSIPNKKVDPYSGEDITVSMIASNPKYGGSSAIPEMMTLARESGFLDESNRVLPQTQVTNPEVGDTGDDAFIKSMDQKFEKSKERVFELLKGAIPSRKEGGKVAVFRMNNGDLVKFDYNKDDGFFVSNWEELGLDDKPTQMKEQDVLGFLTQRGYWDRFNKAYRTGEFEKPSEVAADRLKNLKAKYNVK